VATVRSRTRGAVCYGRPEPSAGAASRVGWLKEAALPAARGRVGRAKTASVTPGLPLTGW